MSCNSNFKQTSIPFLTKSGTPMSYFTLSEDDTHTKVTRAECLAPAEQSDNIYPQRWFVDEESGLVVRLPRNAKSEELARDNMRFFWAEAKRQERRCACIARGSKRCPVKCYNCRMSDYCNSTHKETDGLKCAKKCEICTLSQSRTVDLDMRFQHDSDGEKKHEAYFDPATPDDIESMIEDKAQLDTLYAALATLTEEERDLITEIYWNGKTERQLALKLGLKEPKSVNKRKHRILEILRKVEALRSFFE